MTKKHNPFEDFINDPNFDLSQLLDEEQLANLDAIIQDAMRSEGWQKGLSTEDKELMDRLAEAVKDAYAPFYAEVSEGHWRLIAKDIISRAWAARDMFDNDGFWDDNGGDIEEI